MHMTPDQTAAAKLCLDGSYDGRMSFPQIIGTLLEAGFEGYAVDYRRAAQAYYLPDGQVAEFTLPHAGGAVAAAFDGAAIGSLVQWAQADGSDYSYASFCEKVKTAGCAGYLVSFLGRRVVYYGRTAETHVEMFPQ
jgi:uncharacterized protein YbcV (DUF1398 family)